LTDRTAPEYDRAPCGRAACLELIPMKILYTGPMGAGTVTRSKLDGLLELGYDVVPLDQNPYWASAPKLLRKAQVHALFGPGIARYNRDLVDLAQRARPGLVYVDVGSYIWPKTVAALRSSGAKVVNYTTEYLGNRMYWYWYRHFWPAVRLYDAHIVTNKLSRRILEQRGAKTIVMSEFGYDPAVHVPPESTDPARRLASDLLFIGHWEQITARQILALRRAGLNVKVWGHGWWRAWRLSDRSEIRRIATEDYAKAIAGAKIALCFLSKWNLNESCGRTFEIPAIGTFMLAEKSEQQMSYFAEGKEAAYFGSPDELVEKARYYLANDDERIRIARAGHVKCVQGGFTYKDRIKHDIEAVTERLRDRTAA
jgi:hypothetical protein